MVFDSRGEAMKWKCVDCELLQNSVLRIHYFNIWEKYIQKVHRGPRRPGESEDSDDIRASFQQPSQLPFPHSRGSAWRQKILTCTFGEQQTMKKDQQYSA